MMKIRIFLQGIEDLAVAQRVAEPGIEALDAEVLAG